METNPILFGNKLCSTIKLPHPISAHLNRVLKDVNSFKTEIENALSKMMRIISPTLIKKQKSKSRAVYCKFNLSTLLEANGDYNNSNLLSALRRGYAGETIDLIERDKGHYASRSQYHLIKLEIPDFDHLEEIIEHLIIKLINKSNCNNNQINGVGYFFQQLTNQEHIFIGLHYLLKSFDQLRAEISTVKLPVCNIDALQSQSSQETVHDFKQNFQFEKVNLNYSNLLLKLVVGNRQNVSGVCSSTPSQNQFGIFFSLIINNNLEVRVQYQGDDCGILLEAIEVNQRYFVENTVIDYRRTSKGRKYILMIANKNQIKRIVDSGKF